MQDVKAYIILTLCVLCISVHVRASKIDTIYFQNGDRITAEVKQLENNQLRLSTDDAGTIKVEWNKIDSVKILNPMRVLLSNGRILYGVLLPAGEVGKCYLWTSIGDPLLLDLIRIVALDPMEEKLIDRFSGTLSSGFSYVKATKVMQLNLDATIKYSAEKNLMQLSYTGLFSQDPESGYTQNQSGGARIIRLLPKKWFLISEFNVESNSEMDLDVRTSLMLGGGNSVMRTNFSYLYVATGLLGNREVSLGEEQYNLEALIKTEYSVFIYDDPEVSFTLTGDLIPSLNDLGRVRADIDSNLKWEIFNDFFLKWTFYFSYDSRPISGTSEKNDWAVTLIGVEYKL
jgi:hypothetical protein